jgi:hypothetical protein
MSEAQMERQRADQQRGQVIGCAGENVFDETEVLLTGARCEGCAHCGA